MFFGSPNGKRPASAATASVRIQEDEPVLVQGMRERYVGPWCKSALGIVQGHNDLTDVVAQFAEDLAAV